MQDLQAGPPPIPPALVEWLEQVWPDAFPLDLTNPVELQRQAGRIEVIRLLRSHLDRQSAAREQAHKVHRPHSPF